MGPPGPPGLPGPSGKPVSVHLEFFQDEDRDCDKVDHVLKYTEKMGESAGFTFEYFVNNQYTVKVAFILCDCK